MKKEFRAESKQLLNLMIHSIYSNKEVFLRELISNASDALDKRHFVSIQDQDYAYDKLAIHIDIDKDKRILTIKDNGIGMSYDELEQNLGTIAHSGSKEFIQQLEEDQTLDVIGQFGVGFYSSFIVSDKVEVLSKKVNDKAYLWTSDGHEDYEITEVQHETCETIIKLHIKEGKEYDVFLDQMQVETLIKKYSDYIKYPITMKKMHKEYDKDENGKEQYDKYTEREVLETVNSMIAIWKRPKTEVSQEDYNNFYMSKFHDWQAPLKVIHRKIEGKLNYEMLLFIPSNKGFDFYSPTYQKQIDLYSKGVLIEASCEHLISDAFKFVKGVVDTADLSLNISREMLQNDENVSSLAKAIESKIKSDLLAMQSKERELYDQFYDEFSQQLVYGVYDNFGAKKDLLKDLIMFKSTKSESYVTLKEYVERMKENQEEILYIAGKSIEQINKLPIMEQALEQDQEILYFLNEVDEFAINVLSEYESKKFKSINSVEFQEVDDEKKEQIQKTTDENKDLLSAIKDSLKDDVDDVVLSTRLKSSAVCLVSKDNISLEMEKTLAAMPDNQGIKATKVLEINPDHELFKALGKVYSNDADMIADYAYILYNQALLVEGFKIEDPVHYSNLLTKLMVQATK